MPLLLQLNPVPRMHSLRARVGVALLSVVLSAGAAAAATGGGAGPHIRVPNLAAARATAPMGLLSGPDVSSNNHGAKSAIRWGQVAGSGRAFTIVKATGERGYTNAWFKRDWEAAGQAGLIRAAYHFALPTHKAGDALTQANHFLKVVTGAGGLTNAGTLPLVLDLEQTGGLRPAALQAWVRTFLSSVETATHRPPLIYTYTSFWQHQMGNAKTFTHYPLWIASYTPHAPTPLPGGWASWTLWQYTANGRLPGVRGVVDLSVFCCSAQALTTLSDARPISVLQRWVASGGLSGPLGAPIDPLVTLPTGGYEEDFVGGSVYGPPTGSAYVVTGSVADRYLALGGPGGPLGWPTADTIATGPLVSTFTGGTLVAADEGTATPAYEIAAGPILDRWNVEGGPLGTLGLPLADTATVTGGTESLFGGGFLTSSDDRGTHELAGPILTAWLGYGGADSTYGLPSSDAYTTAGGSRADFGLRSIVLATGSTTATGA